VIAGGHDCQPLVFNCTNGTWAYTNFLEQVKKDAGPVKQSSTKQAFELFKNKVEVGANSNVQTLSTLHQNCISCIQPFKSANGAVQEFTTSALDGRLVFWKAP